MPSLALWNLPCRKPVKPNHSKSMHIFQPSTHTQNPKHQFSKLHSLANIFVLQKHSTFQSQKQTRSQVQSIWRWVAMTLFVQLSQKRTCLYSFFFLTEQSFHPPKFVINREL